MKIPFSQLYDTHEKDDYTKVRFMVFTHSRVVQDSINYANDAIKEYIRIYLLCNRNQRDLSEFFHSPLGQHCSLIWRAKQAVINRKIIKKIPA